LNSDQIVEMLADLPSRHGTAVVLVTHEPRFASYADRVLFLRDGVIVDQTPHHQPAVGNLVSVGS
jgi:ABC-type lipoprotein export system ATPase subunit